LNSSPEKSPLDGFKNKYEALPRPKSWMPGPPAPWSQVDPENRKLNVESLENYFNFQDEKAESVGGLRGQSLPEVAIENLGDNDVATQPAAVLVPLVLQSKDNQQIESIIVMTRTMTVTHHKGQVSFPGGMKEESDENLQVTALRETQEEIGLDPKTFKLLGTRTPVNTKTRTGLITPVVAVCEKTALEGLVPNESEVDTIHNIRVSELVKPGAYFSEIWDFGESSPTIHMYFVYDTNSLPVFIWGATAHILTDILHCLKS